MGSRSNRATIIGLAVFAVGAVATLFVLRQHDSTGVTAGPGQGAVLVATKAIPGGTTGADAVRQSLVGFRAVPARERPANALTDLLQLNRTVALAPVPA